MIKEQSIRKNYQQENQQLSTKENKQQPAKERSIQPESDFVPDGNVNAQIDKETDSDLKLVENVYLYIMEKTYQHQE